MESQSEVIKRIEAQDLICRFRSKEDLFRYLTQQNKAQALSLFFGIVNLFCHLQSLDRTKIGFQIAILKEEKKAFKINEINFMEVPSNPEISVKNLYDNAVEDEDDEIYIPTRKQLSNKYHERKFCFEFQEQQDKIILQKFLRSSLEKVFNFLQWIQRKKEFLPVIHDQRNLRSIFIFQVRLSNQCFRKTWDWNHFEERICKSLSIKEVIIITQCKRLSEKRPQHFNMNIDAGIESKRKKQLNKNSQRNQKFP